MAHINTKIDKFFLSAGELHLKLTIQKTITINDLLHWHYVFHIQFNTCTELQAKIMTYFTK